MAPSTATDGWSKTPGTAGSFTGTVFSAAAVAVITATSNIPQIAVWKRLMAPPRIVKFGGSFYSPVPPLYSFSGPDPDGVDRPDRAGDLSGGTHVERGSPDVHEVTDPRLLEQVGKEHAHVPDLLDLLEGLLLPELDDLGGGRLADLPGVRRVLARGESLWSSGAFPLGSPSRFRLIFRSSSSTTMRIVPSPRSIGGTGLDQISSRVS